MNFINQLIEKHNAKKCEKLYERIMNQMKDSTSKIVVVSLSTNRGYDALFVRLEQEGYRCIIEGNNRDGVFLTVKQNGYIPKY